MNPLIAILWWLSLGAVAIGAFVLGYRIGENRDRRQRRNRKRLEARKS